jgi:hypothetical protein
MTGLPKSFIKKYGGITKAAWKAFKSGKAPKSSRGKNMASKKGKGRTRTIVKKDHHRAKSQFGFKLGKGSIMQWISGAAGLILMQRYQPFGGVYKPAIDKIAIGVTMPMVGLDNRDMLSVGIKEAIATLANSYLGGSTKLNGGDSL